MNNIWLIGAGGMAQDYIKVLESIDANFIVIGRSKISADKCKEATGRNVERGGIEAYLLTQPIACSHAIVSVGVEKLYETTKNLLNYGIKNILVEKPGAMKINEFKELLKLSKEKNANVLIAYNRRFYASVIEAKKIIEKDGGVTSFNFEFTEWSHEIKTLTKADGVKEKWFLANSTHVVDLAFYLGGRPEKISCFTSGTLDWHPSASIFTGAGVSQGNIPFCYQANWESAGRWSVEILTKENRLIFRPMEKLQIQKRGTIETIFSESIDYTLDNSFKHGLYLETKNFLENDFNDMCTIDEQLNIINVYYEIANYSEKFD